MDKKKKRLVLLLIGALVVGSAIFTIVFTERSPAAYQADHDMLYEIAEVVDAANLPTESMQQEEKEDPDQPPEKNDSDETTRDDNAQDTKDGEGGEGGILPRISDKELISISAVWPGSGNIPFGTPLSKGAIHVTAHYSSGPQDDRIVTGWSYLPSSYRSNRIGSGRLLISYGGKSTSVSYTIVDKPIKIEVSLDKREWTCPNAPSASNLSVRVRMASGKVKYLQTGEYSVSGLGNSDVGSHGVHVSYEGLSGSVSYEVKDKAVRLIASWTGSGRYAYNAQFRRSDVSAQVVWASGKKTNVGSAALSFSGMDTSVIGEGKRLTVSWQGLSDTLTYDVYNSIKKLEVSFQRFIACGNVSWQTLISEWKTQNNTEPFHLIMADGSKKVLDASKVAVSGYDPGRFEMEQTIKVSYEGYSVNLRGVVKESVLEPVVKGFDFSGNSQAVNYQLQYTPSDPSAFGLQMQYEAGGHTWQFEGFYSNAGCTQRAGKYTAKTVVEFQTNAVQERARTQYVYVKYEQVPDEPGQNPEEEPSSGQNGTQDGMNTPQGANSASNQSAANDSANESNKETEQPEGENGEKAAAEDNGKSDNNNENINKEREANSGQSESENTKKEAEDDKDSTDGKSDGESENKEESHEAETGGDE